MFNTVVVADRVKKVKHKNRNGPRSKDEPNGRRQNEGRETGKEIKQTMQIEIGRDEKKQVDERKNQNVGENKYIELNIKGGRN